MIAEAIVGWLVEWLASGTVEGAKRVAIGTPTERALSEAIAEGLEVTVRQVPQEHRGMLRMSIDEHLRDFPWGAPDRSQSLRDGLAAYFSSVILPLADPRVTGTGRSFLDEIGVDGEWLGREFSRQVIQAIERVAVRDGALAPLAARLDADAIRAELAHLSVTAIPASVNSLPHISPYFTNREKELVLIREIADAGSAIRSLRVCLVDGMAGVGKSAFAIAAAHRLTGHYPDAQLYLDLHGYTPGQQPVRLAAALEALLRVIGVPAEQLPISEEAQVVLWRSRTARMRFLLILDNAWREDDVEKMFPGSAECLVLVTSRRRLVGLPDSHVVSLEPLSPPDASTLLRKMLASAATADDTRVAETVAACGYLPLPITLVGGRLRGRRSVSLEQVVNDLASSQDGLAHMHAEDRLVMTAFELSYDALDTDAQVLLRRLAICPASDFDDYLAAALTDAPRPAAARQLDELVDHSLLVEAQGGRYQFHDLVKTYVRRIALEYDSEADRERSIRNVFSYYQLALKRVNRSSDSSGEMPEPAGPEAIRTPPLSTQAQAAEWFTRERPSLVLHLLFLAL